MRRENELAHRERALEAELDAISSQLMATDKADQPTRLKLLRKLAQIQRRMIANDDAQDALEALARIAPPRPARRAAPARQVQRRRPHARRRRAAAHRTRAPADDGSAAPGRHAEVQQ